MFLSDIKPVLSINTVDIYSRYIRIKPLEYVKTKSMIIYVYVSKDQNKNDSDEEEIVKYTLIQPINKSLRHDGYGERCPSPDWVYQQHYKTVRKAKIKNMLEEQLESVDDI